MTGAVAAMRLLTTRWCAAVVAAVALTGCAGEPAGLGVSGGPVIEGASIAANPRNVLSAIVSVRVRDADSVAVRFRLADAVGDDSVTPAVAVVHGAADVPVLGLLSASRYSLRAVAFGDRRSTQGEPLELTTGELPAGVPRYGAGGLDPTPGYVVLASGSYGLVIDNTGRVVWYHHFADGLGLNFAAQPNGRFVARLVTPDPTDLEPWLELDPLGSTTRTLGCAGGLQPRFHDLLVEPGGDYWIMCDETRTVDLSADGGAAAARVTGTAVQHVTATGELRFHWSPFDHLAITDLAPAERTGDVVNWTHGNALDLDADGHLLVSFRNLNEITKIDVRTGNVIWRLGGLRNQFAFIGTPAPPFAHQHSVRRVASGALLLLDNIGDPAESRAERYVLDAGAMTARLEHAYASEPRALTQVGGSTQVLPGGRTLVSFGTAGRVEEYDADGRVVWRIVGHAGYVFRAQRIRSLYAPGVGLPR